MEERFRFVDEWRSGDWNMAELCRFYGVSRTTGYKWVGRYEAGDGCLSQVLRAASGGLQVAVHRNEGLPA